MTLILPLSPPPPPLAGKHSKPPKGTVPSQRGAVDSDEDASDGEFDPSATTELATNATEGSSDVFSLPQVIESSMPQVEVLEQSPGTSVPVSEAEEAERSTVLKR